MNNYLSNTQNINMQGYYQPLDNSQMSSNSNMSNSMGFINPNSQYNKPPNDNSASPPLAQTS